MPTKTRKPQDDTLANLQSEDAFSINNIRRCERYVFSMQKRLDRAVANNNHALIRTIFNILVKRSQAVKILAVYRITYKNAGKKTAGVDGVYIPRSKSREITDNIRYKLLNDINISKKPDKIKRTYIPKPNGSKRPLGIPTIRDRINQEIIRIALEPIIEYHGHDNSFGFRPKRSCFDAEDCIHRYLSQSNRKRYIIEADIKGCFDNINHRHILGVLRLWRVPIYAIRIIRAMLKSEIFYKGEVFDQDTGTPQGGVISPMLCNVAMTCLDTFVAQKFGNLNYKGGKHYISPMIRYADDFIILCESKQKAKQIKSEVADFINKNIGLTLSDEKTKITHIKNGFDFLGWNFRKRPRHKNPKDISDYKLIVKPSWEKVTHLKRKIRTILDKNKQTTQEELIRKVNPIITGWGNYHIYVNAKTTFVSCDYHIWVKLYQWAKRRHPNKSAKWVLKNYFQKEGKKRTHYFRTNDAVLKRLSTKPITRYRKVKNGKRVYNQEDQTYWYDREQKSNRLKLYNRHLDLFKKQKGDCPYCKSPLCFEDEIEIHHIKPKALGGSNSNSNLMLTHAECHREIHSLMGKGD